ncbi:MAG: YkgJ family cysteine cluster protein [Promethearchaeota archaeon]|jgi:Fe-S-cluster containining protein
MDHPNQLRFTCTRCGNCCTDKNTLVNVTHLDILRLYAGLKLNEAEILEVIGFYIFEKDQTNITWQKMVLSPVETEKGFAFPGLFKKKQSQCYFYDLDNKKCLIYTLRPTFCRTFPFSFEYSSKNEIIIHYTEKSKLYCPGIGVDAPLINIENWMKLAKKTLNELNENNIFISEWNKKVKNGSVIPSAKNFIKIIIGNNEKK